ncbi:MAG: alpha/beta hydrolase-fold protein [Bacteroidota bacterium]
MKRLFVVLTLILSKTLFCQETVVETFNSKILNEERVIRIHIPKTFDTFKKFPLFLTLDGEYMFYNLVGNSELLLATEKIPETVIVGIDQNYPDFSKKYMRWQDCNYDAKKGKLRGKGIEFKKFITQELIPYLTSKYKIGNYKVLAGHSLTASYTLFLLKDDAFTSVIALSPYISKSLSTKIIEKLSTSNRFVSLYVSTSEHDLQGHLKTTKKMDSLLITGTARLDAQYIFNFFEKETHYSLINRSFPVALQSIFREYQLITEKEIEFEKDVLAFLKNKYKNIKEHYDIDLPIRKDDLETIYWVAEEREDWELLQRIGDFSIANFPAYSDGYFMLSAVAEQKKKYTKDLELYQKGYERLGDDVLNKVDYYKNIERLQKIIENKE